MSVTNASKWQQVCKVKLLKTVLQIEALKEGQERSRAMQEEEQRLLTTHAYYMVYHELLSHELFSPEI